MDDALATAYHEAGHAVVARWLGQSVRSLDINETDDHLGLTLFSAPAWLDFDDAAAGTAPPRAYRWIERISIVTLAGPLAEEKHTGTYDHIGAGLLPFDPADPAHVGFDADVSHVLASGDMRDVADHAEVVCGGPGRTTDAFIEYLKCRTRDILDREDVWHQVSTVADALAERRRLSRQAFDILCVQADVEHFAMLNRRLDEGSRPTSDGSNTG